MQKAFDKRAVSTFVVEVKLRGAFCAKYFDGAGWCHVFFRFLLPPAAAAARQQEEGGAGSSKKKQSVASCSCLVFPAPRRTSPPRAPTAEMSIFFFVKVKAEYHENKMAVKSSADRKTKQQANGVQPLSRKRCS